MNTKELNQKNSNLRTLLNAIADEYTKAYLTNRLGTWTAAAISIIELYGGENIATDHNQNRG